MKKTITFLTFLGTILMFGPAGSFPFVLKPSADKTAKCEAIWEKLPKEGDKGIYYGGRGIIARKIPLSKRDFMNHCQIDFQNLY
jgi:hypothetical protein